MSPELDLLPVSCLVKSSKLPPVKLTLSFSQVREDDGGRESF